MSKKQAQAVQDADVLPLAGLTSMQQQLHPY